LRAGAPNCWSQAIGHGTIAVVHNTRGPGLAKIRDGGLVTARQALLVSCLDARWRAIFDGADAVSEGAARAEGAGSTWYGSTSLVLTLPAASDDERSFVAGVAASNPHVRLRAVRITRREAETRAPLPLGRAHCEVRAVAHLRGLRIDVEVQAPLIESRRRGQSRSRGPHAP